MPEQVGATEPLARYLTQSKHYHEATHSVRPKAFDPPPDLRLSVFRIESLAFKAIWDIGIKNVINKLPQPRTLYGMARITCSQVRDVFLDVVPDDPPSLHACIVGWPQDKSERMQLAQELAAKAVLILKS